MQFIRRLCDEVNFKGRNDSDLGLFPYKYWMGYELEFVHCYFNVAVIRKR